MNLYGHYSHSIPQKITIHLLETALLIFSYIILFGNGGVWVTNLLSVHSLADDLHRKMIFVFNIIIYLRLGFMMFFLLKRNIPWEETLIVPFAFALYYIGFSLFVLPSGNVFNIFDVTGIVFFVVGCVLNTASEVMRNEWKKRPENHGKLYTKGLFRYSRHINYFGDVLWVSGYALVTHNAWAATVPVFLFFFFAFYNAPALDAHLATKYGEQYHSYAAKTKMLIPFVW